MVFWPGWRATRLDQLVLAGPSNDEPGGIIGMSVPRPSDEETLTDTLWIPESFGAGSTTVADTPMRFVVTKRPFTGAVIETSGALVSAWAPGAKLRFMTPTLFV